MENQSEPPLPHLALNFGLNPLVHEGEYLTERECQHAPHFTYPHRDSHCYTWLLFDPDAPDPEGPTNADWVHWLVVNVRGEDASVATTLLDYAPPKPPMGTHNYQMYVYEQLEGFSKDFPSMVVPKRWHFKTEQFVMAYKLKPIAHCAFKVTAKQRHHEDEDIPVTHPTKDETLHQLNEAEFRRKE